MPTTTYSAHYIADPALRRGIADYLKRERACVAAMGDELAAAGPYRQELDRQQLDCQDLDRQELDPQDLNTETD
jgi:hypothetical protein